MTRKQLLKAWQREAAKKIPGGLNVAEHEVLLKSLCQTIAAALAQGDEVPLPHIGKLKVRSVAARTGRNPRTGAPVAIPAKRKVIFVVGRELKESMSA